MSKELHPGDIMMLPGQDGLWGKVYEYIGPDPHTPGRVLVCERGNRSSVFSARPDGLMRPALVGNDPEADPPAEESPREPAKSNDRPITDAQRRHLFALGRSKGLDVDDLRAITPGGHISTLTRAEAAAIINRLRGSSDCRPRFTAQGTATAKQLGMIAWLRDQIGFTPEQFEHWMARRFGVGSMKEITDRSLASRMIGGLTRMRAARSAEHHDGPSGRRHRRSKANATG